MDHRAQEWADGVFLFASIAGVDGVCRASAQTPLALLQSGAGFLCTGTLGQNNGLHPAGGAAVSALVAKETN